jgi:hypothetical protein
VVRGSTHASRDFLPQRASKARKRENKKATREIDHIVSAISTQKKNHPGKAIREIDHIVF